LAAPTKTRLSLAYEDVRDGVCAIYIWPLLGWLEIRQRYQRSLLGPFWLTISTGIMLAGMGPLYSMLFGRPLTVYLSHLAISLVVWLFISGLIIDSCTTFIHAEGYIKQMKLPLTVHVMRSVWKNVVVFAHNLVIVFIVMLFYPPGLDWHLLLAPIGVLVIALNGIWAGIVLGLLCARFRDIPLIVTSLVQVAFFLTPVFWMADMLGRHQWAAQVNPLFHFLEIVRRPLMGQETSALSWAAVLAITLSGYLLMFALFQRYRARIAYWV
jgi:ABC-type polysaccharide/polyol phosphate export permease